MYRPHYFFEGYAIHGSTFVPAYPDSHGCVRVTVATMDRLAPKLRIGMRVSIYR
jgi:lipoprotein-anchoring transpeptidase ErfK/SrfK